MRLLTINKIIKHVTWKWFWSLELVWYCTIFCCYWKSLSVWKRAGFLLGVCPEKRILWMLTLSGSPLHPIPAFMAEMGIFSNSRIPSTCSNFFFGLNHIWLFQNLFQLYFSFTFLWIRTRFFKCWDYMLDFCAFSKYFQREFYNRIWKISEEFILNGYIRLKFY